MSVRLLQSHAPTDAFLVPLFSDLSLFPPTGSQETDTNSSWYIEEFIECAISASSVRTATFSFEESEYDGACTLHRFLRFSKTG